MRLTRRLSESQNIQMLDLVPHENRLTYPSLEEHPFSSSFPFERTDSTPIRHTLPCIINYPICHSLYLIVLRPT